MNEETYGEALELEIDTKHLVSSMKKVYAPIVKYVTDVFYIGDVPAYERCVWVLVDDYGGLYHYDWLNASIPVWWDDALRNPDLWR